MIVVNRAISIWGTNVACISDRFQNIENSFKLISTENFETFEHKKEISSEVRDMPPVLTGLSHIAYVC